MRDGVGLPIGLAEKLGSVEAIVPTPSDTSTGVTVIVPAYNEEGGIGGTIQSICASMVDDRFEILVVDDGSSDGTAIAAHAAGARVVSHPHNVGYGRALKTGIRAAGYDTIAIIDADLTYPSEALPRLLEEYRKGFDLVVGARQGYVYEGGAFKGPLRRVLRALVEYTADRRIPDANSGLRVFSRATVLKYLDHLCDTFSFTTSQTLAYMMTSRFVSYVPIAYRPRVGKTKVNLFWDSLHALQQICQMIIYYRPFKIFFLLTAIGGVSSILSFLVGISTGIRALYLLSLGGVLMSVFVFCLGLLADQLRQILNR
jgi:glycosyltransferase involved in cell wall biosynthesis